jgi:ABC-type phosphate/phosphonate transport system permease subunit
MRRSWGSPTEVGRELSMVMVMVIGLDLLSAWLRRRIAQ